MAAYALRVRYAETDQMGVAHHAAYIPWLEAARIDWLRQAGHSYRALESAGLFMPVITVQVRYRKAARFDDELEIDTEAQATGPSRVAFRSQVRRGSELLAEAEVVVAAVDGTGRPVRIPASLLPALTPG
jgi:acyl-CoA thioester hydrolase